MRNLLLAVVVFAAFQNWDSVTGFFDSTPDITSYSGEKVIMYSTQWCGYCARARRLFESNGVPYSEYDIERSSAAREQYDALGGKGVPLMVINGNLISGYSKRQIMAALQDEQGR